MLEFARTSNVFARSFFVVPDGKSLTLWVFKRKFDARRVMSKLSISIFARTKSKSIYCKRFDEIVFIFSSSVSDADFPSHLLFHRLTRILEKTWKVNFWAVGFTHLRSQHCHRWQIHKIECHVERYLYLFDANVHIIGNRKRANLIFSLIKQNKWSMREKKEPVNSPHTWTCTGTHLPFQFVYWIDCLVSSSRA